MIGPYDTRLVLLSVLVAIGGSHAAPGLHSRAELAAAVESAVLLLLALVLIVFVIDRRVRARYVAALAASEARFRQLAEHIDAVFYLIEADGRDLIYVSPAYERVWGRSAAELYADPRAWYEAAHLEDRARVPPSRVDGGGFGVLEYRIVRPDGEVRWILDRAFPVQDERGRTYRLAGLAEDITERKQAEDALRASQARVERITANMPGMVYQFVFRPDQISEFTTVSEGARRLLGVTAEAILQDPAAFFDLMNREDWPGFVAAARTAVETLAPMQWEGRFVLPTGEERYVQLASRQERQPDGSVLCDGLVVDVTERRRAAQRLEASEERYRLVTRATNDIIYDWDILADTLYLSDALEAALGHAPPEIPYTVAWWETQIHPEDRPAVLEDLRATLASGRDAWRGEYRLRRADASYAHIVDYGYIVRDAHGAPIRMVGAMWDQSRQRDLEEQLRQAQKMEAIGRLAGGIAHDFNNLLTGILGHSELALAALADGSAREDLEVIRETAVRAGGLTRQLLAFSRQQVVEPQLVDLNGVVRDTERLLHGMLRTGITLEPDLADVGAVLADRGQLEQVLVNLVVNARDAMPEGGIVTIRTRDVIVDEAFARGHKGLRPGAYATLTVADTGVGMDVATQARIFEPFFTTKPVGEGTGLGLAMVYGIVKQWHGYVALRSAPGAGATFTVYLPRHDSPRYDSPHRDSSLERPAPTGEKAPAGTETLLVVDDEETVRASMCRILRRQGYKVLEARHGADALRLADAATGPIDLVVTDLVMPEMNGRDLITHLQARATAPRILVISGYDEQAAIRGEPLPPGVRFLQKPFTIDELLRSVRAALAADGEAAAQ